MQPSEQDLKFKEKKSYFFSNYSLGAISGNSINDKLILISLLSFVYFKMKEKTPTVTVLDILKSITKQKQDDSSYYQMIESLAIIVEDFCYGCSVADNCGLKSSQEIINKIKEILGQWLPF